MDANMQPFCFEGNEVRTIIKNEEPWFVAKDVCDVLEIGNPRDAVAGLDEDEKLTSVIPTSGQNREMNIISESGLYNLVFKSRKPQAKSFRRWVTHDVLPQIRKTGKYNLPQRKEVSVNHKHLRASMAPGGLDIKYQLDLTRVITNPTRNGLEILERLTGITFSDIDLGGSDIDSLFLKFVEECCVVGDDERVLSFLLYQHFTSWAKGRQEGEPVTIKKFSNVVSRHFSKMKSNKVFILGLRLKEV